MKQLLLFLMLWLPFASRAQSPCVSMAVIGSPCAPALFQFLACTANATDAQWSFPGSTTLSQSGLFANALYTAAGTYSVSVTIDLPTGTVDTTFGVTVSSSPVICVSQPLATGCTGQTLCFDASCTAGTGLTYRWNFGDGDSSDVNTPCHDYTASGCYTVQLAITDSFGCQSDTVLNDFACVDPLLVACFTSVNSPCNCAAPYTVALQSCSTPSTGLTYQWSTPGGNAATPNASTNNVTYNAVGVYDVMLTVSNASGCNDTSLVPGFVCISSFSPSFEILDSVFETGIPITFLSGPATSFAWTVNPPTVDTTDNNQILTAVFNAPGTYEVCLLATFNGCAAEKCTTLVITNPTAVLALKPNEFNVVYDDVAKSITLNSIYAIEPLHFELVDLTGRVVLRSDVTDRSTKSFNAAMLVSGVYAYAVIADDVPVKRGLLFIQ